MLMSFFTSLSVKKLILMWFFLFPLYFLLLLARSIVLLLSWCTILSFKSYTCASMNKRVHKTMGIISSIPTSLDSVELWVLSFWFEDVEYRCPCPRLMVPLVCTQKSSWNLYDASLHHLMIMVPSASRVSGNHLFALIYLMVFCNFFQSSISGYRTSVHRKGTSVWISSVFILDRYSSLAIRRWNRLP